MHLHFLIAFNTQFKGVAEVKNSFLLDHYWIPCTDAYCCNIILQKVCGVDISSWFHHSNFFLTHILSSCGNRSLGIIVSLGPVRFCHMWSKSNIIFTTLNPLHVTLYCGSVVLNLAALSHWLGILSMPGH